MIHLKIVDGITRMKERIRELESEVKRAEAQAARWQSGQLDTEQRLEDTEKERERLEARVAELEKIAGHCTCEDCMNYEARERETD